MAERPKNPTMTALLLAALAESKESLRAIAEGSGVNHVSILKFKRGEQSLRLDHADKLAAYFEVRVQPPARRTRKG
jgi:transcriptional regulator with XRE-family HTH domain